MSDSHLTSKECVLEIVKDGDRWALQMLRDGAAPRPIAYSPVPIKVRHADEPSARQCNHGAISPKGTMLYHGYVQPKANLWRCDVCKGIYEGNLTEPNTLGSQALTLVGPSEPPSAELPAILFDGYAVLQEVKRRQNGERRDLCDTVSDVLDAVVSLARHTVTKSAECGACDKPGEHCANVHGICSRHGGHAHETEACRQCHARPCICVEFQK